MAKKGGKRGSSAARSAAAKKGWETRRKGGAKSKPSTPSKPKAPPKTTTARGRARTAETRARAAVKAGGGTRATRSLLTAQRARDWYKATGTGTKRSKVRSYGPANGIRRTGVLPKPIPANGIRPTTGPRRAPLAQKFNAIRPYRPASIRGRVAKKQRRAKRRRANSGGLQELMKEATQLQRKLDRRTARDIANRGTPGVKGRIARIKLTGAPGSILDAGKAVIRRRAARASAAAERGSKPAARAREIYANQLARTGAGGPSSGQNNLRPGPRNTKGTPKPKRKRKR